MSEQYGLLRLSYSGLEIAETITEYKLDWLRLKGMEEKGEEQIISEIKRVPLLCIHKHAFDCTCIFVRNSYLVSGFFYCVLLPTFSNLYENKRMFVCAHPVASLL